MCLRLFWRRYWKLNFKISQNIKTQLSLLMETLNTSHLLSYIQIFPYQSSMKTIYDSVNLVAFRRLTFVTSYVSIGRTVMWFSARFFSNYRNLQYCTRKWCQFYKFILYYSNRRGRKTMNWTWLCCRIRVAKLTSHSACTMLETKVVLMSCFSDKRTAQCWTKITNDRCEEAINGAVPLEICCNTVGKGWGSPCSICPAKTGGKCVYFFDWHC